MADDRWVEVSASQFDHESEGLGFLRAAMPNQAPFRVWTNFEFRDQRGGWHEVDALVLGQDALYLLELKHFYGTISGNDRTWTRNGRTESSPLLLARRKAQYLASKLQAAFEEAAGRGARERTRRVIPWVQAAVFLHHRDTRVALAEESRLDLYGLDELENSPGALPGISALFERRMGRGDLIGPNQEAILAHLLEKIGLVQRREREVGSWSIIEGGAIAEGEGWQDWEASGKETGAPARIRFLTHTTDTERRMAEVVASHEFEEMRRLHHDGLIRPIDVVNDSQLGRGLVYDWDPSLQRFDLWLEENRDTATLAQRLQIIRQVGEVLDYAHGRGVAHRRLTPRTVWIGDPTVSDGPPTVKVSDWQSAGSADAERSRTGVTKFASRAMAGEEAELGAYEAPEGVWTAGAADRPGLDQFSLGAVAFFTLAGQAPAASAQELMVRLREQDGLDLGAEVPGIAESVREAVRTATKASPKARHGAIRDFLAALEVAEQPVATASLDPREAGRNDVLADGRFTVVSRLGKGSTALGLLVEDSTVTSQNKLRVLKVALDEKAQQRLVDEAEVLGRISSRRVVTLHEGPFPLGPTTALLLESAGEHTLKDVIRRFDRGLPMDLLERYSNDLLTAMEELDKLGIDHRDIKPANLGIGRDTSKVLRLALFDFSLSRAAVSEIEAGTAPYLDPFLGADGRDLYDSAAERYAAAVVLYEMTTGRLPRYGEDERANPAAVVEDVTLDSRDFPHAMATDFQQFFSKALTRRAGNRFGTVAEMHSAWRALFGAETTTAPSGAEELASQVALDTPLAEAGLSPRALSWFTGEGFTTVEDVVVLDSLRISRIPGIAKSTREEVRARAKQWRDMFPGTVAAARRTDATVPPLEDIAALLVNGLKDRRSPVHRSVLDLILARGTKRVDAFAPQVALGAMLSAGTPTVNRALLDIHEEWLADEQAGPALAALTKAIDEIVDELGGVAALPELVTELLRRAGETGAARGSAALRRLAEGLLRIVVDGRRYRRRAEDDTLEPLEERRRGDVVIAIARSAELLDLATALGARVQDAMTPQAGVRTPARSRELIAGVLEQNDLPGDSALRAGHRALRLGAALSQNPAGVSAVGELHRRDLPAAEAMRLALAELSMDARLSPQALRDRVSARFPALPQIPGRPQLDTLVVEAGLNLRFDSEHGEFVGPTLVGDSTRLTQRPPTVTAAERAQAEDAAITRRLEDSRRRRSYLVLGTEPTRLQRLEQALRNRFATRRLSVAPVLLEEMRHVVDGLPATLTWDVIVEADNQPDGSRSQQAVAKVVELALPAVLTRLQEQLAADGAPADDRAPLVLTDVDMLVRYGHVGTLRRLSDLTVARDRAVWVIVPQYSVFTGPVIDGVQLTTSPHQFLDVDREWSDTFVHLEPSPSLPDMEVAP